MAGVAAHAASVKDSNLTVNLNPMDFQAVWGADVMSAVSLIRACFAQRDGCDFAIINGDCFLCSSVHNFLVLCCGVCAALCPPQWREQRARQSHAFIPRIKARIMFSASRLAT